MLAIRELCCLLQLKWNWGWSVCVPTLYCTLLRVPSLKTTFIFINTGMVSVIKSPALLWTDDFGFVNIVQLGLLSLLNNLIKHFNNGTWHFHCDSYTIVICWQRWTRYISLLNILKLNILNSCDVCCFLPGAVVDKPLHLRETGG